MQEPMLPIAIIFSVMLHLGAVAIIHYSSGQEDKKPKLRTVVTAVLVRKGKPRPAHLLPRIHQAPKRTRRARRYVKRRHRKKKRRHHRRRRHLSLDDIIKRTRERWEHTRRRYEEDDPRADHTAPAGIANGSELGTVSDPALARAGSLYGLKLRDKITRNLNIPPFFKRQQIERLKHRIQIVLYLSNSGKLLRVELSKSSGDRRFDSAVLAAVKRAAPYPPPPEKIRALIKDGIEVLW